MNKLAALTSGALIALAATLSVATPASASIPGPEGHSYSYQFSGPTADGYGKWDLVQLYRDNAFAGNAYFSVDYATNHLGQHRKGITIQNRPGISIHIRVDAGSSVVDYHANTAGATFTRTFYYSVRKFRVTLDGYATPWFAPPLS
jgi:hypothetical protein